MTMASFPRNGFITVFMLNSNLYFFFFTRKPEKRGEKKIEDTCVTVHDSCLAEMGLVLGRWRGR